MCRRKLFVLLMAGFLSACAVPSPDQATTRSLYRMADSLHRQLGDDVVGYAFALGTQPMVTGAGGLARVKADGGPTHFTPETPMIVASVSKLVSALATMRLLPDHGLSLDDQIGPYFPTDWAVDPYVKKITFAQLLNQTSGIKDFGNGPMTYQDLKAFFTQPVDPRSTTPCGGLSVINPKNPVTPDNLDFCYSNFNAAILTILLPRAVGLREESNPEKRALASERQYEHLVQKTVFEAVGVKDAACAPRGNRYALSYIYPGDAPGKDWGPQYSRCATGGWYVSPIGLVKVLTSVARRDGRILLETKAYSSLKDIRARGLGLDRNSEDMIEKNGVLGDDPGVLAASAIIFSPDSDAPLPAVLFTNSTNRAGAIAQPRPYLERARREAFPTASGMQ